MPLKAVASSDCGDYAADSMMEDIITGEAEPCWRYDEGLYYPIRIGEVLHNRYRIEHKLGWGGFSTVWLAQDTHRNVAVALKVLVAGASQREVDIHNRIAARLPDSSGFLICRSSFFVPRGEPGNGHWVLVFPVRGPSLQYTYYFQPKIPPALRMSAAKHVLLALRTLHDGGFIHRDLTLANIMWQIRPIDHLTTAERYQKFGRPQKVAIDDTGDGKPGDLVLPIGAVGAAAFPMEFIQGAACIGDFGLTLGAGDRPDNLVGGQPLAYQAPEILHGHGQSFANDIWSFMIIFANLYVGADVVVGGFIGGIVRLLGPIPSSWRELYNGDDPTLRKDWWYAGGGAIPHFAGETLEHKIDRLRPEISKQERAEAISFIRRGLTYSPSHRPTAAQLLEDPSFKALMGYYGCEKE